MRTTNGKFVRELCDFPLAENISISFNSDREGLGLISWRADKPSALYWYVIEFNVCQYVLVY